jgi:hypothetical protein
MLNPKVHLLIFLFGILLIVAPTYAQAPVETNPSPANTAIAQVRVTATPVRVQLPTQSAQQQKSPLPPQHQLLHPLK